MIILNKVNGADEILFKYASKVQSDFKMPLTAVLMGIAYGGEVEEIAKIWKDRGEVYGYDTFEDLHPGHLFKGGEEHAYEKDCMGHWYKRKGYGTEKLAYDYQRNQLDEQGLDNAILIKGEVHKDSCKDLKKIHLAFLDMDMVESMDAGYNAVKDKIVKGGYLCLHDVIPANHIPRLYHHFQVIINDKSMWKVVDKNDDAYMVVLQKI